MGIYSHYIKNGGLGSVVGIATGYGLDCPGIESSSLFRVVVQSGCVVQKQQ